MKHHHFGILAFFLCLCLCIGFFPARARADEEDTVYDGVDYSLVYDYDYYTDRYPDVVDVLGWDPEDVLWHFVKYGMSEGRRGNATFDVHSYQSRYADLRAAYGDDLQAYYLHYIRYGYYENRIPSGSAQPKKQEEPKQQEQTGKLTVYDGIDYSLVYDYDYYTKRYPDITRALGTDPLAVLRHFVNYGMKEGRQGNESFSVISYRNKYQDLRVAFGNDLPAYYMHYIKYGHKENRVTTGVATLQNPVTSYNGVDLSSVYDFEYYTSHNPDVVQVFGMDEVAVIGHFANYGMREGRTAKNNADKSLYPVLLKEVDPMGAKAQSYESETDYLIIVDLTKHQVEILYGSKGNWQKIDSMPCSNGAPETPTPTGEFETTWKFVYFDSGDARCWYATGFVGGYYLFHSILYYQESAPITVMDPTLGAAVSHGCVRLPLDKALWIYDNVPAGTKVVIY